MDRLTQAVLCVALVACCSAPGAQAGTAANPHATRVRELTAVERWAPVFGGFDPRLITGFDLAVVDAVPQPDGYRDATREDVELLHDRGMLVLAYLSVGTVERWRHYAAGVPSSWTLAPVEGWEGERYVDARARGWRELMRREARALAAAGFDGLYLDNLDVAEGFPQTRPGVVTLVRELRRAVPDILLVAQNGLSVATRIPIDGIAHEDVFARWNGKAYVRTAAAETRRLVHALQRVRDRRSIPVFTLDYALPGSELGLEAVECSLAAGFRPTVSVLDLDQLPHAPAARHAGSPQRFSSGESSGVSSGGSSGVSSGGSSEEITAATGMPAPRRNERERR